MKYNILIAGKSLKFDLVMRFLLLHVLTADSLATTDCRFISIICLQSWRACKSVCKNSVTTKFKGIQSCTMHLQANIKTMLPL